MIAKRKQTLKIKKEDKPCTVGEYVKNDTWQISLLDAKEFDKIEDGEYLSDEPDEGKKFLVLFFEVENISSEDDYFNYFFHGKLFRRL
ncbi:MAG: DUF4352 domain-containing protein [Clostridiales bacterium]|nr:DUF4352 domain-containing protein [Clostridiales bacterium]